ncbi:MAG: hypothetical protein AAFU73_12595 [Planctomycetota bacterium]
MAHILGEHLSSPSRSNWAPAKTVRASFPPVPVTDLNSPVCVA